MEFGRMSCSYIIVNKLEDNSGQQEELLSFWSHDAMYRCGLSRVIGCIRSYTYTIEVYQCPVTAL